MKTTFTFESALSIIPNTRAPDSSLAFRILSSLASQTIHTGNLSVIDIHGRSHDFGNGIGKRICLRFLKSSAYLKILLNPDLYFGEAYMNGDISIEEGNIADFLELILKNAPSQAGFTTPSMKALNVLDLCMKRFQQLNTTARSLINVSHHYDLSSDLYELFLDQERQYSCAYFPTGLETLEEAQQKKMQLILGKLLVEKNHHVLDIGCGWGSLARFIARETGARVTGLTLSKEQLAYAENKTQEEGLSERVDFKLCDYRNLEGTFDRIVSVGMFEHVGVNYYHTFFQTIRKLMNRQGVALIHSIGRSTKPSTTNPWIQKYIFPGGYIPSLSEVIPHIEKSGMVMTDLEVLRLHYAKTLNKWRESFMMNQASAKAIYDERFCRMWEFYLACSEVSFKYYGNVVFHIQLATDQEMVPLTRNYLYERA